MKLQLPPRFDPAALRACAGDAVFRRGEAYHSDGAVTLLGVNGKRVLAEVSGSENYRTVVTGSGAQIGGECSCRAFEDWGFCKHMVAAALAANQAGPEADGADALSRIREHLGTQSVDRLVDIILDVAENDPALFQRLELQSVAARGDSKTLERRLKDAIDRTTRVSGFLDYGAVGGWAGEVHAALEAIGSLAATEHAPIALRLSLRAIDRITSALGHIDDSDGHGGSLLEQACNIHFAAAERARPEPVRFARDLFAREVEDEFGIFAGAVRRYAEVLGETGLAEYRRLAMAAWEKLPPRDHRQRDAGGDYHGLMDTLDFFAEQDGDVDMRIALRRKDLSSPWDYLGLAELCVAQGRPEQGLKYAEEGLWVFEDDRPDERLVLFTADHLLRAGRQTEAEAHLWRAFEKQPSHALYDRLRGTGGVAARDRALERLKAGLGTKQFRWDSPSDFYIRILMQERMFDAAWQAVRIHSASVGVQEELARACEKTHPREAIAVYAARVDQLAGLGGNPAYEEVVALIGRMATLRSEAEQHEYVATVKQRFGRKRNLMKLLD